MGSDYVCRGLAIDSGCLVVSVEYRLAPETAGQPHRHDVAALRQAFSLQSETKVAYGPVLSRGKSSCRFTSNHY